MSRRDHGSLHSPLPLSHLGVVCQLHVNDGFIDVARLERPDVCLRSACLGHSGRHAADRATIYSVHTRWLEDEILHNISHVERIKGIALYILIH